MKFRLLKYEDDKSKGFLLALLLLYFTYLYLFINFNFPLVYEILVIINSSICIWNMVNIQREPYSLRMLINIFIYIFFILANAIQFGNNNNHLTFYFVIKPKDYILFQITVLFILIIFNKLYAITKSKAIKFHNYPCISTRKSIYISLFFTFIILYYFKFNLFSLFARGFLEDLLNSSPGSHSGSQEQSWAGYLIFDHFIRPIPWAIFLLNIIIKKYSKKQRIILFLCTLLTVFPTGLPRNAAAMYWLPILLIFLNKYIKGRIFIWIMFFGLFFIFPLLDNFRNFDGNIKFEGGLNYLDSMHFDASQIFMVILSIGLVTYGKQLLGVFLFFFPRSFWADKPIGSGAFLVETMKGYFTNVSMPFFGEGYINFGFIGILLFTIFLAIIAKKLDSIYWKSYKHGGIFQGYYLIILSAIIFIMRGDLMSSFAYTLGLLVCFYVVIKVNSIKLKLYNSFKF